jgi:hypothetical protein
MFDRLAHRDALAMKVRLRTEVCTELEKPLEDSGFTFDRPTTRLVLAEGMTDR